MSKHQEILTNAEMDELQLFLNKSQNAAPLQEQEIDSTHFLYKQIYYYPIPNSTLIGNIDSVNEKGVSGWVFDKANPEQAVEISVYIDNLCYGCFFAHFYREDLKSIGYGNGYHAFDVSFPAQLRDNRQHTVTVITPCGCIISPSPQSIVFTASERIVGIRVIEHQKIDSIITQLLGNENFLVFTGAEYPFSDSIFLLEKSSQLIMTMQRCFPGKPDIDIRGLGGVWSENYAISWEPEFFCESEGFIGIISNNYAIQINLTDMSFASDWFVNQSTYAVVQSKSNHILPSFIAKIDDIHRHLVLLLENVEITNTICSGSKFVQTQVKVGLATQWLVEENLKGCYVYQDAAYLWFPRASQMGIVPFSFTTSANKTNVSDIFYGYSVMRVNADRYAYVGYYDFKHGVFAVLHGFEIGALVGVVDHYLSVEDVKQLHDANIDANGRIFKEALFKDLDMKVLFHCTVFDNSNPQLSIQYHRTGYYKSEGFADIEDFEQQLRRVLSLSI